MDSVYILTGTVGQRGQFESSETVSMSSYKLVFLFKLTESRVQEPPSRHSRVDPKLEQLDVNPKLGDVLRLMSFRRHSWTLSNPMSSSLASSMGLRCANHVTLAARRDGFCAQGFGHQPLL
jgi:hypothetical protein